MEWHPIETAPKDDGWIIGLIDGNPQPCIWDGTWWVTSFLVKGRYTGTFVKSEATVEPTHWMPLPEPPNAAQT